MPRRTACARCAEPIQLGGGSLPPGQATCRDCRMVKSRPFDESKCGTERGRDQHRRHGQESCEPCREAWNEVCRQRQARLRESGWVRPGRGTPRREPCGICGEAVTGWVRSDSPMHNDCRPVTFWSNAIQISKRGRLAIYERDGWECQLCGDPVDSTLDVQDRMAATLDHIAPRALTLFPDDSPENLRLAHRACNSARGIRVA